MTETFQGVGCCRSGCKPGMWRDGFSARDDKLWTHGIRTGLTAKESRREEWPLQGVFTLHVTDLQQRLASRRGVHGVHANITHPLRRPTLCFPLSHFRHDANDDDDDCDDNRDNDGRPPAAIVIAAENCRSPEAVKHVPLILPPLDDDDYLIYEPHLGRRSSAPPLSPSSTACTMVNRSDVATHPQMSLPSFSQAFSSPSINSISNNGNSLPPINSRSRPTSPPYHLRRVNTPSPEEEAARVTEQARNLRKRTFAETSVSSPDRQGQCVSFSFALLGFAYLILFLFLP